MGSLTADLIDGSGGTLQSCQTQFAQFGALSQFQGPLRTVRCADDTVLVKRVLDEPGDGQVLVIDGGGSLRCALLGDRSALGAVERGWAGIVVYGTVRDVDALREVPLGIKAIGTNPRRAAQLGQGEVDVPVGFGSAVFVPGEMLWSDADGVLTTPLSGCHR